MKVVNFDQMQHISMGESPTPSTPEETGNPGEGSAGSATVNGLLRNLFGSVIRLTIATATIGIRG